MKKLLSACLIVAPLALAGCGSDDKTYVVTPPTSSPSAGTVVVPGNNPPAVQNNTTKVCPSGAVTC